MLLYAVLDKKSSLKISDAILEPLFASCDADAVRQVAFILSNNPVMLNFCDDYYLIRLGDCSSVNSLFNDLNNFKEDKSIVCTLSDIQSAYHVYIDKDLNDTSVVTDNERLKLF